MSLHELKTWPEYFEYVWDGSKSFEVRKDDRGYEKGDYLHLREWSPSGERYTGREVVAKVDYVMDGHEGAPFGLEHGYVVMAIERLRWRNHRGQSGFIYPDDSFGLDEDGGTEFMKCLEDARA